MKADEIGTVRRINKTSWGEQISVDWDPPHEHRSLMLLGDEDAFVVRRELTADDVRRTLEDERHGGWGYACTRDVVSGSRLESLDRNVAHVANELGMDYEQLFDWANSKYGRWLADGVYGRSEGITRDTVRGYLNPDALEVLKEGL